MIRRLEGVGEWWTSPAGSRWAYAVAAAIGLGSFLIVYRPGYLLGTSSYWQLPWRDHRAYLMGYRYFLHEPWHWPIFQSHTMDVPHVKSIAFTDSIPAWAFVNKGIATIVPPWRSVSTTAYLGFWYGLVNVLQPCLGVANLRALGHRSRGNAIVTALFFIAVPAWTFRFMHASLYAQFLLLWALYLYFRTPANAPAPTRLRILQIVQLGVAALINPYHTVMCLGVFLASLLRSRDWKALMVWVLLGFGVVLAALGLAGYFTHDAKMALFGFDSASSNLLAPFLPRRSGWFGNALWVDPTGYQYEGVAYLGLGFLVLFLLFLPRIKTAIPAIRRHVFLVIVAAGAAIFALSNRVYLGSHLVMSYRLPHALSWVANQFRCPGRLVWLPMYAVMIFLLARAFARFSRGWRLLVLPLLALVQTVDVSADWAAWRTITAGPQPAHVALATWRQLIDASKEMLIYPANDCITSQPSDERSLDLQYLASQSATPIDGIYSARPSRNCDADVRTLSTLRAEPGVLYVFLDEVSGVAAGVAARGVPCRSFVGGTVCSLDGALLAKTGLPPPRPLPSLRYGEKLDLGDPKTPYLGFGWSWPDPAGRWSDGPFAGLGFRLVGDPPATVTLYIEASAALCGPRTSQEVDVAIDGEPVGTLHFDTRSNDAHQARALSITDVELLRRQAVELELRPRDLRSPSQLHCNQDTRRLGVLVHRIWFE